MVDVKKDLAKVGKFAREIVAKRVGITAGVAGLLNFALFQGWVSVDLSNKTTSYLTIGLNVTAAVVAAIWSRDAVTPADPNLNPTSSAGEALAPVPGTAPRADRPAPTAAATIAADAVAALSPPAS